MDTQSELLRIEHECWEAVRTHDGEFFERFLTRDGLIVTQYGTEDQQLVKQMIEQSGGGELHDARMHDVAYVPISEDAGALVYKVALTVSYQGARSEVEQWISTVYTRRDNQWVAALHHQIPASELPQG